MEVRYKKDSCRLFLEMREFQGADLIRKPVSYVRQRKLTIGKFLLVSGSAVGLNLFLLFVMVKYLGFNSLLGENLANAITMELSIIYNFFMSRAITWHDRYKERGRRLSIQIVKFHIAIGLTILLRMVLFAVLQRFGVYYIVNAAIGIAIVAIFNFIAYDTVVFRKER